MHDVALRAGPWARGLPRRPGEGKNYAKRGDICGGVSKPNIF